MTKKGCLFSLLLFMLIITSACANDSEADASKDKEEGIEITLAHVFTEDVTQHKMFMKFKELMEADSDGKIKVEVYPNGELGGEREIIESVQGGTITMSAPSVGVLSNFSPALGIFDFPFIFKDTENAYSVLKSDFGEGLLKDLEDSGFVGLGFNDNGWRHLTNSKQEITTPDQVEGLNIRTMEVPMHMTFWESLGTNPTPMAFTEVFTALQQGVVDGQENPLQLIYSMKFHEPNKYITTTGHIFDPEPIIMNKDFFDGLSAENQELVRKNVDKSIEYLHELNKNLDEELRGKLEAEGAIITDLTPEQRQLWVDALTPVYKEHASEVDTEKLKALLEAAGNEKFLEAIE